MISTEVKKLGAIVPKTVTLHACEGIRRKESWKRPRECLTRSASRTPGADGFIRVKLPPLQEIGVPLIISILGHTDDEFVTLTEKFHRQKGVSALELNLSCPNLGKKNAGRPRPGSDPPRGEAGQGNFQRAGHREIVSQCDGYRFDRAGRAGMPVPTL